MTVCNCGHDQGLHDMEMQDNLCLLAGCLCWNFTTVTVDGNGKTLKKLW